MTFGSRRRPPTVPFAVLVASLQRHYSFSELKQIDWDELSRPYRDEAQSADSPAKFAAAISGMLARLNDIHVWIELPDGTTRYPYGSSYRPNFNYAVVRKELQSLKTFGRLGFAGRTEDGFGVLVVQQLPAEDDGLYRQLIAAAQGMFDAPGFILDLRANAGGSEPRAAEIAGLFADKDYLYARSRFRGGPDRGAFRDAPGRHIAPAVATPFVRPVVCLVGPGCVSSGEGFALMLKALDHATLVGQPTRGASGNPQPVTLPNGVRVWYSRWMSLEVDGTPIEGRGVQPDIVVDHSGDGDATFDFAVKWLRDQTRQ